jgi:hypothetical protein
MWNENTAKTFLLGCLYGFEKDNSKQILEFNCPNIGYMIDMTVLMRYLNIPFHVDKKGLRLLVVTDKMESFNDFLKTNYGLDYNYPLKIKWPEILEEEKSLIIPFIDGVFETAGIFTNLKDKFPFVLHLQNEKTTEKISEIIQSFGVENIWIKNPNIRSLCTIQIIDGKEFSKKFTLTNPNSKYKKLFLENLKNEKLL